MYFKLAYDLSKCYYAQMIIDIIKKIFKKYLLPVLRYLFRNECGLCLNESSIFLCDECKNSYKDVFFRPEVHYMKTINANFKLMYIAEYSSLPKDMVIDLKYRNKKYMIKTFIEFVKDNKIFNDYFNNTDYISYIPSTSKTIKKRGYNQSEELAKELGKIYKKEVLNLCIKIEKTNEKFIQLTNNKMLSRKNRYKNIQDTFISLKEGISGRIILVDDVYTTGATFSEMVKTIKIDNPNAKITCFSLCYKRLS